MSLWTSSVLSLLLLQSAALTHAQPGNDDSRAVTIEEVTGDSETPPRRVVLAKRDWNLTRAYLDVFAILTDENQCSSFYGGPRAATTVLNGFVTLIQSQPLQREVLFQMAGNRRLIRDRTTGASYRLFDRTMVNSNGAFYQRRAEAMRKFPSDVGSFAPGSRPARALILLHELGHLIQGKSGDWLIPDDGHNGRQSKRNTLRVEEACRVELESLK
jgi:hypothetical protein